MPGLSDEGFSLQQIERLLEGTEDPLFGAQQSHDRLGVLGPELVDQPPDRVRIRDAASGRVDVQQDGVELCRCEAGEDGNRQEEGAHAFVTGSASSASRR